MENGKVLTLDEAAVVVDTRLRYEKVAERAGLTIAPRWPVI